jgi:hypothetical protein
VIILCVLTGERGLYGRGPFFEGGEFQELLLCDILWNSNWDRMREAWQEERVGVDIHSEGPVHRS